MTEPSQYFRGRTIQEQMDEVIGYVDKRAGEVAAAKADAVLQPAEAAKTAAQAAAEAAEAAKDTTLAALPAIQDQITAIENKNTQQDNAIAAMQTADGENVKINNINQYAVGLTGNQEHIAGVKSFENSLIQLGSASPTMKPGNDEKNVTPPSDLTHNMLIVQDNNNNNLVGLFAITGSDGKRHLTAYVFDCDGSYRSQMII